jgi:CHAT domain-containing protein/tetratricopeptide (TPR) repeat protein
MCGAHFLTGLARIFFLFPALLCAQNTAPGSSGAYKDASETGKSTLAQISDASRRSDVLRQRAEVKFQRAVVLQDKQTAKDLLVAAGLFRASARFFLAAGSYAQAADAHLQAGDIYFTLSQYDKSRRSYREALQLGHGSVRTCRALSRLTRTYAATGPLSLVQLYSTQAIDSCRNFGGSARAESLEARGEALDFAGDRAQSEDFFRQAQDLFVQERDENGQARTLLMLAYTALFWGNSQAQGLQAAEQTLRLWSSRGNKYGTARMRSYLGMFAINKGEFETAQCNYKLARPVFHGFGNKDDEASVLNGLGYVNSETGDWQKSLEYYQQAKAIFASVHDMVGGIESIRGIGKALTKMGNVKLLLPLYQQELRLARQSGDPVAVAGSLADLASAYELKNRYIQAEASFRRALEGYREAHHLYGEGAVLMRLGRLQAKRGRYSEAIASLESANVLEQQLGEIEEIAKIQYELARAYLRLNRLQEAKSAIEKTIEIVEKQRLTISHFDSRASYFAAVHAYYGLYIEIYMLLDQKQPGRGFAEKAFDASERSRARSLLDLLTTSSQEAPCEELLQRQLQPGPQPEVATPGRTAPPSSSPTLTLKEVQAEIEPEDTVLLEYALGDEKSYVWRVEHRQITAHELPQSERIRKLVESFRETLIPPQLRAGESASDYQARVRRQEQSYRVYARQLSRVLLGPIALTGAKRLLIVPDASLQYVPFTALLVPACAMSEQPLVTRYEVDVLPSASVLGTLRKTTSNRAPPPATAVIVADPVFESDDPRVLTTQGHHRDQPEQPAALNRAIRDIQGSQYIPRLHASRDEANAIASILHARDPQGVHVALDFSASRDFVVRNGLTRFRFVHFATHGIVDPRQPEMSGLILSLIDRKGQKQDGYLRLGDIYKLQLSADLVVLSSCESALGKDLQAEGIIGLPRGFLHAGAKSVIASLWKVNDEATAKLMAALYTRIQRGESPSAALRGAQLEMVHDEQWSKPYYWAAFVLQGEYR